MPLWHLKNEYVDTFGYVVQKYYESHFKRKDLSSLRLTVVEALNNITDHANSKISGFIATQYFRKNSKLIISICDFGIGIPTKVNQYLKKNGEKELNDINAIKEALKAGFSTKTTPQNRGVGLDNILSYVKASEGEIEIVSNRAYYSKQITNNRVKENKNELDFSFPGTYLIIKLNTSKFRLLEKELEDELKVL